MMITEIPLGTVGRLFRSQMPFSVYDPRGELLTKFQKNDIAVIVLLAGDQECQDRIGFDLRTIYQTHGFEVIHFPIPDFGIPDREDLVKAVDEAIEKLEQGENVLVHCHAGIGRTGMFVASLAKKVLKISGENAIKWVRQYIPGAVEIEDQKMMVVEL
jgi:protein-tyrosine phosphatase